MCTKKQVLIFLAGAEAFHTLLHIAVAITGPFPHHMPWITLTETMNAWAIAINAAITAGFLFWAAKLKK